MSARSDDVETVLGPVLLHAQALRALNGLVAGPHLRPKEDLMFVSPDDLGCLLNLLATSLQQVHDTAVAALLPPPTGGKPK